MEEGGGRREERTCEAIRMTTCMTHDRDVSICNNFGDYETNMKQLRNHYATIMMHYETNMKPL